MSDLKLVLKNQFGEESDNYVLPVGSTLPAAGNVADGSVLANLSGSSAPVLAVTLQALSTKLPAKLEVGALSPLAGGATLTDVITQLNALLAALKAIT